MLVNFCSIILDVILAYVLGKKFGLLGIASGFAIACTVDALLMFSFLRWHLHKHNISMADFDDQVGSFLLKIIISSIAMGLIAYGCIYLFAPLVNTGTTVGIIIQSGLAVGVAILAFLLISYKLGVEQTKRVLGLLKIG